MRFEDVRTPARSANRPWFVIGVVILLCNLGGAIGCGDNATNSENDTPTGITPPPPEWWGVWASSTVLEDDTEGRGELADTMSICEDFDFGIWMEDLVARVLDEISESSCILDAKPVCSVSWTSTTLEYTCDFDGTVTCSGLPCNASWNFRGTGSRSGNSLILEHDVELFQSGLICQPDTRLGLATNGFRIAVQPDLSNCPGALDPGTSPNLMFCTIDRGNTQVDFIARDTSVTVTWSAAAGHTIAATYTEAILGGGLTSYAIRFSIPPQRTLPVTLAISTALVGGSIHTDYRETSEVDEASLVGSGTMILTEAVSNHVVGTFSFSGTLAGEFTGMRTITEGLLDVGTVTPR